MPLPIENGGRWENFVKGLRGLLPIQAEYMVTSEERIAFERDTMRANFYGCLRKCDASSNNFNYASIPHPSETIRAYARSLRNRLIDRSMTKEDREALWQEAREKACRLINHPDPRGVLLTGNTTQAISFFHWLNGMLHGKNRVALLEHVTTTDIENSATYRTIFTLGEDGNPHGRDGLTTFSNWNVSPVQEGKRSCSLTTYNRLHVRGATEEQILEELRHTIKPSLSLANVPDTLLLSHVDRETGREIPVKNIIAYARELKAKADPKHPHLYCVVDGAQALGNVPKVDWNDLGADMYIISPHKTMGSERIGIAFFNPDHPLTQDGLKLLGKPEWQEYMPTYEGNFHPDLHIPANAREDKYLGWLTGIQEPEINPIEVASFSRAVDELVELGYVQGNDFSALDRHRAVRKEYCKKALEELSRRTGIPIVIPPIDRPTNFILSFRVGPEQKPVRQLSLLQSVLPDRWRPDEPEDFGHEIGRRLSEQGIALTYFSVPNLFRVSFDRDTTQEGIDRFISVLEEVLREIPELNPA